MSDPGSQLAKSTQELTDLYAMLAERQPGMIPRLQEEAAKLADWAAALFQPFMDLAEGRITIEEFNAIHKQREVEEQARRREHYLHRSALGLVYPVCEHCATTHEWVLDEHEGEWPPIYFECVDVDGVPCPESIEADDDDDDDDEDSVL